VNILLVGAKKNQPHNQKPKEAEKTMLGCTAPHLYFKIIYSEESRQILLYFASFLYILCH
jgi:hypothetical protein